MFRPLALYIGLRYTRAKRRNHFISFISLASMLGIALGVTALITVLSVMNGFDRELRGRILGMASHASILGAYDRLRDWPEVLAHSEKHPEVLAATPYIRGQGLLTQGTVSRPTFIQGIIPSSYDRVSSLSKHMVQGQLDDLKPGEFGIIMGQRLANSLGLTLGDKITLVIPEASVTPTGVLPRFKRFTLVGTFEVGYDFDTIYTYIDIHDAATLFRLGNDVTGVRLKLADLYTAPRVVREVIHSLPGSYRSSDWTREHGNLFEAIKLEKTLMFLMLLLIIAVAAFNMVSSLVMLVNDKRADIAILRTLGASPRNIMNIFMIQGSIVGTIGILLGLVGGVTLALNVTEWVAAIESHFEVEFLSSDVYYISFLPSELRWADVAEICGIAFIISFLATLYPAWQAGRTQPVEALRYE